MYKYYKVKKEHEMMVNELLEINNIEYNSTNDNMEFICEELVDNYIENSSNELRPLLTAKKDKLNKGLMLEMDDFVDTIMVLDILDDIVFQSIDE